MVLVFFILLKYEVTVVLMCVPNVCLLYAQPCLASQCLCSPTVFLDVHLSLSARPLWACLPACGHLFTSSSISRHGHHPHPHNHHNAPSPPWSAFSTPLSCRPPPDTSCEPLMLILQSTSCGPVISLASTALSLKLSLCSAA